jgi:DNA-binding MarR family transcriptional regulator
MTMTSDDCAHEVLDVVPVVMRVLRAEMRAQRGPELSVPHFRVLAFLGNNEGASLSEVAEYVGLRLPSMSTLVNGLVTRGLVSRVPSAADRRRLALCLTPRGRATLNAARRATQARLAKQLACLSHEQQETVAEAMRALRALFAARPADESDARLA